MKKSNRMAQALQMCRPFIWPLIWVSLLIIVSNCLGIIFSYYTGTFVQGVDSADMKIYWESICGMTVVIFAGKIIDTSTAHIHINRVVTDMQIYISLLTLDRTTGLSVGQITNQNSGFNLTTIQKGEGAINELAHTFFFEFVPVFVRVGFTSIAFLFLKPSLAFIVTTSCALFTISSILINHLMVPRIKKNRKEESKIDTFYLEIIKNLRLVIISNQRKRIAREIKEMHDSYNKEHKSIWTTYIWSVTLLREPFAALGQIVLIGYAGHLVMLGELGKPGFIATIGWSYIAFGALGSIGTMQRRLVKNIVLMGRFFDLLEIPPAIVMVAKPIKNRGFEEKIEFRNVWFKHPVYDQVSKPDDEEEERQKPVVSDQQALHKVNVTIKKGEIVALIGDSGSGKSTFVSLLLRNHDPDHGEILVDGRNLRELDLEAWRDGIGLVDQQPAILDKSVRYNMTFGLNGSAHSVSNEELDRVAKIARIDEFYPRLGETRFDTMLGENGVMLSGGQRQRITIARALMNNPQILILDEATNSLDPKNERFVHQAIRQALNGRTGIIIAHRLSTVQNADKIMVFDKGSVIAIGTHTELMKTCPAYQDLVSHETGCVS